MSGVEGAPVGPEVRLTELGHVATVIIDRPHRRNALARSTMQALEAIIDGLAQRPLGEIRAVVIAGAEGRFVAGGDLYDLAELTSEADGEALSRRMQRVLRAIADLPMPVIAAVEGHALGGGAELALACDLRVMAPDAVIAFRQIRLAVTTAWGATRRLHALVGPAAARRLLWLGDDIGAEQALALGLVDEIAPARVGAEALAARLARRDPAALRDLKRLLRAEEQGESGAHEDMERALFGARWAAPAHLEVVDRWLNRRPPSGGDDDKIT